MDKQPENVKHQRIPTLDGWRAVAILGVMGAHIIWPFPWLERSFSNGGLGVQLFFALSGFLITTRLLEEYQQNGSVSWKNFYLRRAFRILPPALFALLALAILGMTLHLIPMSIDQLAASAFFYRNYLTGVVGSAWYTGHFWSLAVEEHFYLLWPAVLCVVGFARGARAALSLAVALFAWRIVDRHRFTLLHPGLHTEDHRTDYCIGELFWGCFLAFVWHSEVGRRALKRVVRSYWIFGVIAVQLLLLHYKPRWYDSGVELLIAFMPIITVADPKGIVSRVLDVPLLTWIGRLSYSLYLWQQLFLPVSWAPQVLGIIQKLPFNLVAVFSAASCSYYFVERPFISLGRRLQARSPHVRIPGLPESVVPLMMVEGVASLPDSASAIGAPSK